MHSQKPHWLKVMKGLSNKFHPQEKYSVISNYHLLPFRFIKFGEEYFLSNEVGEYLILSRDDLESVVLKKITPGCELYDNLKSKHFIYDSSSSVALDLLSLKVRTRQLKHSEFTRLHMFVVTLRCDYSCQYCQVSRQTDDKVQFDMSVETADKALICAFKSPARSIKLEMQGGEPLLNFKLIKYIIERAEIININAKKDVRYVITTNLTYIDDEIIDFCRKYNVHISTSLDGFAEVHNKNRPRPGKNGYQLTLDGIRKVQESLGHDKISAVMTTTEMTLSDPKRLIDSYIEAGLNGIFLRPLSPYGFAIKTGHVDRYNMDRWLVFYKEALDYIIEVNKKGYRLVEFYTNLFITNLYSPIGGSYVDLQSPAGAGLAAITYNYDGKVYCGDEARMLAETGEFFFQMGDLHTNSYEEIFLNENFHELIDSTVSESLPQCNDCAYLPYCGTDPLYHFATQNDMVGHKAFSSFCQKNMGVFEHVINIIRSRPEDRDVLLSWYKR